VDKAGVFVRWGSLHLGSNRETSAGRQMSGRGPYCDRRSDKNRDPDARGHRFIHHRWCHNDRHQPLDRV